MKDCDVGRDCTELKMQVTARSDIFAYVSKFILQQSFGVLVQSVRFRRLKGSRRLLHDDYFAISLSKQQCGSQKGSTARNGKYVT